MAKKMDGWMQMDRRKERRRKQRVGGDARLDFRCYSAKTKVPLGTLSRGRQASTGLAGGRGVRVAGGMGVGLDWTGLAAIPAAKGHPLRFRYHLAKAKM